MKKFAIAGAVLAVAVLIGYTSTTTILGNNVGNDKFLAEITRENAVDVNKMYPLPDYEKAKGCPKCWKEEGDYVFRELELMLTLDSFIKNQPEPTTGKIATKKDLERTYKNRNDAQIVLDLCKQRKQEFRKAYCQGYEAARVEQNKASSSSTKNLIQKN